MYMKICLQKISLLRPNSNPRNKDLNLNINWITDFNVISKKEMQFNCILESSDIFASNFKIEGILKFKSYEKFEKEEASSFIVELALDIFHRIVSDTRDREISLNNFRKDEIIYNENKSYGNRILN